MKPLNSKSALAVALAFSAGLSGVSAQVLSVEPISATIISVSGNDQTWEARFPNVFDPARPKRLLWEGTVEGVGYSLDPQTGELVPAGLTLQFDWIDPQWGKQYSPGFSLTVNPTGSASPVLDRIEYLLPFCPPEVSIHFRTDANLVGVFIINGAFTHECLIPEPADYGLIAALGAVAFGVFRRRQAI
ncbi:MAG: hypothetical protein HS113_01930 [Verrucomicrobiales bacterium]|nr:hypothetical protein [Verrucomicrobiales bacterium]